MKNALLDKRNCPNALWQILRLTGERLSSIPAQEVPLTTVSRCVCLHGLDGGPPPSFIRGQLFLTHPSYMPGPGVLRYPCTVQAGYNTAICVARHKRLLYSHVRHAEGGVMFGILKKLLGQEKPPRRTRGKGRKVNGISTTKPHQPEPNPEPQAKSKPKPTAPVQEGPVREPVGEAQGDERPGKEDTGEDQERGGAGRKAPVARKRRSKKSKAGRPD